MRFELVHLFTNVGQWTDVEGILAKAGFGKPHHRLLFVASRMPGLTVNELVSALRVTHQNLRLPMKQLMSEGYLVTQDDEADRRRKLVYATQKGQAFSTRVVQMHAHRIDRAIAKFGHPAMATFLKVHEALMDGLEADWMRRAVEDIPTASSLSKKR